MTYRVDQQDSQHLVNRRLLYTTCDEDSRSELKGLRIDGTDDVLCVTGSGCRVLSLLSQGPHKVVAVDGNPLQNHLLELKAAAINECTRTEFLSFIGHSSSLSGWRLDTYRRCREHLSEKAVRFWDMNEDVVESGILYSGAHEQFYANWIGRPIRVLRRRKLKQLFGFTDLDAQKRFFEETWLTERWRKAVRLAARPRLIRGLLRDPSYYKRVEHGDRLEAFINEGLKRTFSNHLARDNDVFALLVLGRYLSEQAVPVYMRPEYYDSVREHIDRLEIVTGDLKDAFPESAEGTFSKFSLSDIAGWMSEADFLEVLRQAAQHSREGSRIVYRDLFSLSRLSSVEAASGRTYMAEESELLTVTDAALVFRLHVLADGAADGKEPTR